MRYLEQTFTLPAGGTKLTQTEWEIRVGLRHPDGSLVQPKRPKKK